jgi:hypothetical protein
MRFAIAAGAALAVGAFPVVAQLPPPETGIRADRPPPGSQIRRQAVTGSRIPINRKYHELTAEQKAIVHGWYESIAPGDEPPFPVDGMKPIHDAVRKAQARLLVTGNLFLVATVEPNGEVSAVKAIGSPSPEMTRVAGSVLLLTKFKPAVCGSVACAMDFPVSYSFRLER